jgi:hypothetical protein
VRAFPVQAPEDGISLLNTMARKWLDRPHRRPRCRQARWYAKNWPAASSCRRSPHQQRHQLRRAPGRKTDRGDTEFVLRGEEDIRRLTVDTLLISDIHGIHFLIRDLRELDKHSKIIDRFLYQPHAKAGRAGLMAFRSKRTIARHPRRLRDLTVLRLAEGFH